MLIISEDSDGRFALSTNERLIVRETLDSLHMSFLHMDNTDGMPKGWVIMKDSSKEKVQQKFTNLVNQWKAEHLDNANEVFEISNEEVI